MRRMWLALLLFVGKSASAAQSQTFNIFAAASLKESASEIAHQFEKRHPNITVSLNFGGSQQLVAQIREGAPVDILLSAGFEPLKTLQFDRGSVCVFATNKLALIVPYNSRKVHGLQDLGRGVRLIVAANHVPVGHYTEELLAKAQKDLGHPWFSRVGDAVISREQDVRAVLAKVSLGEADAGFVYTTDVPTAKGKVKAVPFSDKYNVVAQYPAVRFKDALNEGLAKDFINFLIGPDAQKTLASHGFGAPQPTVKGIHSSRPH